MATVSAVAESNDDGCILFAFAFPGACGWGHTEADARERLRSSLRGTQNWLVDHDLGQLAPQVDPVGADIEVTERVPATGEPLECDTEGFFEHDRAAYVDEQIDRTRTLLEHTRADLRGVVDGLTTAGLDHRLVEDRRTVREILDHVAIAEHWYLTRVELRLEVPTSWRAYPDDTVDRLAGTRTDVYRALESLRDVSTERRTRRWDADGERWSYRKLLRRLVWHERLHTNQLERLVPKVVAGNR